MLKTRRERKKQDAKARIVRNRSLKVVGSGDDDE
jgi:hypothetical protein